MNKIDSDVKSHTKKIVVDDIRCIECGYKDLRQVLRENTSILFLCDGCGAKYGTVFGIPYFGKFEQEDILGLIEIAANIGRRNNFGISPFLVDQWEEITSAYHKAKDKLAFLSGCPEAQSPYFLNRYNEWLEILHLTKNLNLDGCNVLDMGAGLGFDSHRLSRKRANVTALDFSPVLAEAGQNNFPNIRWICGFSHCMPFKNEIFDAVFCNAALHHMRDIPTAISEALRVLRPDGFLITTCDSFRPSNTDDKLELKSFDNQPAVLLGVNEDVPKFSDFTSTLELHSQILDVEIYTHILYDYPYAGENLIGLTRWNLAKDGEMLSQRSGSLAMRIRLKETWPEPAKLQLKGVLEPDKYASWMNSASCAIANLSPLMPSQFVDMPFPGFNWSKFELLNGWRLPKGRHKYRIAYHRGRWFLRRPSEYDALYFEFGLPSEGTSKVSSVSILLDAEMCGNFPINFQSKVKVTLDISHIPIGRIFSVELQQQGGSESLDGAAFVVRNRKFSKLPKSGKTGENMENSITTSQLVFSAKVIIDYTQYIRALMNKLLSSFNRVILNPLQSEGRMLILFVGTIREKKFDALCYRENFPKSIRWPLYLLAAPGPISRADIMEHGLSENKLVAEGYLQPMHVNGWFRIKTLTNNNEHKSQKFMRLFWSACNPIHKFNNSLSWRRDLAKKTQK